MKRFFLVLLILLIVALAIFGIWAATPLGPLPEAEQALISTSQVNVTTKPYLTFSPVKQDLSTGVIVYPGGRVDPVSYAPTAFAIASQGYLVVVVPMPLNLAVFAPNRATEVVSDFPEIDTWVIGGHSLGGAMAAQYVDNSDGIIDGLFFWASYPPSNSDLSTKKISVSSIFGTRDGLTSIDDINSASSLLPLDTNYTAIEGGNHAQFGYYGDQRGDQPATISRDLQQEQVVRSTLELIEQLENK